jgi:hypothetical protein
MGPACLPETASRGQRPLEPARARRTGSARDGADRPRRRPMNSALVRLFRPPADRLLGSSEYVNPGDGEIDALPYFRL